MAVMSLLPPSGDIVVAHRHPLLSAGLAAALGSSLRDMDARKEAVGPRGARASARLVIADHDEAIRVLSAPRRLLDGRDLSDARWLVVSVSMNGVQVRQAMAAGILGYVDAGCQIDELLTAARAVLSGRRYLCRTAAVLLAERWLGESLTPRELDVLQGLCAGLDNKSIGARLGVAPGTIKTHVKTVLAKLRVSNRTQAATEALRQGLFSEHAVPTAIEPAVPVAPAAAHDQTARRRFRQCLGAALL